MCVWSDWLNCRAAKERSAKKLDTRIARIQCERSLSKCELCKTICSSFSNNRPEIKYTQFHFFVGRTFSPNLVHCGHTKHTEFAFIHFHRRRGRGDHDDKHAYADFFFVLRRPDIHRTVYTKWSISVYVCRVWWRFQCDRNHTPTHTPPDNDMWRIWYKVPEQWTAMQSGQVCWLKACIAPSLSRWWVDMCLFPSCVRLRGWESAQLFDRPELRAEMAKFCSA